METNAITVINPEDRVNAVKLLANTIRILRTDVLVSGQDYGVIPGTGDKPTLLLPGMEKLMRALNAVPRYIERRVIVDYDKPLFHYEFECQLTDAATGQLIPGGVGLGLCTSMESSFRWRESKRKCPQCGNESIFKSKDETRPGWYCWAKKGGCGAKFALNDPQIVDQQAGRIENPDICDQINSIMKRAKKRALGDAIKGAANVSEFFTVDMEDFTLYDVGQDVVDAEIIVEPPLTPAGQPMDEKRTPANSNGKAWYTSADTVKLVADTLSMSISEACKVLDIQSPAAFTGDGYPAFIEAVKAKQLAKTAPTTQVNGETVDTETGEILDEPPAPKGNGNAYGVPLDGESKELRMIRRIVYNGTARGSSRWSGIVDDSLRVTLWPEDMKLLANLGHLPDDQEPELIQDLPGKDESSELSIPVYVEQRKNEWRIVTVEPPEVMPEWAKPATLWIAPDKLEKGDVIHLRKGRPHKVVTRGLNDVTATPCHPVKGYEHAEMKTLRFAAGQLVPVERKSA